MQINKNTLLISCSLFVSILLCASVSRGDEINSQPESDASVYIIYTNQPESDDPKAFYMKTLTAVLGSEDAAKKALVYTYKYAISGFSASLTPAQAEKMSKQPGVFQVIPSSDYHLDIGPAKPSF